tara:strand:- start:619 stop:4752 length:4134 start_codon:yes stop_codon:yes gene_type:complete
MSVGQLEGLYKPVPLRPNYFPRGTRVWADDPIGFWGQVGTMLKYQYSPAYATLQSLNFEADPDFKPEDHIDFRYEDPTYLMNARSEQHLAFMRRNQIKQSQIKKDMQQVSWQAMLVGAMADPLTWAIPFSLTGKGIYAGIKSGMKAGFGYGAVSESLRAPFDPTNTSTETLLNIGGSTVFGGAVGGAFRTPSAILKYRRSVKRAKVENDQAFSKFTDEALNNPVNEQELSKQYKVNIKIGPQKKPVEVDPKSKLKDDYVVDSARIKENSGATGFILPSFETYLTKVDALAQSMKLTRKQFLEQYKGALPTTKRQFELERTKDIAKFIEEPAQPAVSRVLKKGGIPFSSNAFGRGKKGVFYKMKEGGPTLFEPIKEADIKAKPYIDSIIDRKTNTINIDKKSILESFEQKRWSKPRIKGVKKLPDDTFKTPQQWYNFVLHHQIAKTTTPKKPNESIPKYENRINRKALEMTEDFVLKSMETLPIKDEFDLALPNTFGNIVTSGYRRAIQYVGPKSGKKLPQDIKRLFHLLLQDGSVLTKGMMAGRSMPNGSVLANQGQMWGRLGEYHMKLENLHYQFIRNLKKVDPNIEAPRGYFGYKNRDKFWTRPDGKTFGEFLERVTKYYINNVSDDKMRSVSDDIDLGFLKFDPVKEFGRELNKYELKGVEVLKEFFETYKLEAMNADMFTQNKQLQGMRNNITNFAVPRVNEMRAKVSNAERLGGKFEGKPTRYWKKALQNAEADEKNLRAEVGKIESRIEAGEFMPPFEENYFSRVWDREKIQKYMPQFRRLVERTFEVIPYKLKRDLKTGEIRKIEYGTDFGKGKDGQTRIDEMIEEILNPTTVEDMSEVMAPLQVAGLHSRNLIAPNWFGYKAPDGTVWRISDFINTDPMDVMRNYTVRVAPKIEFKKLLGGTEGQVQQYIKNRMKDEGFEPEEITQITTDFNVGYRREVGAVVDRQGGVDQEVANNLKGLGTITFLSDSGRASIVDAGNVVFQYGFRPYQQAMETFADRGQYNFNIGNRKAGEGLMERYKGVVAQRIVDNSTSHPVTHTWGKVRDKAVDVSMDLNLLRPLTMFMKELIGGFAQHDIIEKSLRYQSLSPNEKANLARHFIGQKEAMLIAKNAKKYPLMDKLKRYHMADFERWDKDATKSFLRGVTTHQNIGSLTANSADKFNLVDGQLWVKYRPFMRKFGWTPDQTVSIDGSEMIRFQSNLMAIPFMFWNYGLAANQKILQAGFDPTRPLTHRLFGASIMIGLGYFVTSMRMPDYLWDNMGYSRRMARAVHMSGVTGMYTDLAYMAIHMTKGAGLQGPQNEFAMYNPDTFDAFMEPFGAGIGLAGDYGRGFYTMFTDSVPHGLAQIPYPLQYNMFIRDEVREMRRMLRNM